MRGDPLLSLVSWLFDHHIESNEPLVAAAWLHSLGSCWSPAKAGLQRLPGRGGRLYRAAATGAMEPVSTAAGRL